MSIESLVDVIHSSVQEDWNSRNKVAFEALFGGPNGRYPKAANKSFAVRAPEMATDSGVPFAAYIHPSNPSSGPYSGLSFVIFPVKDQPALVGLVVGTQGLTPDEAILGRPGHARKIQAICSWLNRTCGQGRIVAWAKQDPTRTDLPVPDGVKKEWAEYKSVFDRYGKEMYAIFRPTADRSHTKAAVTALLDLLLQERDYEPMASCLADCQMVRQEWFEHLMSGTDRGHVEKLLSGRRYVIIQGPPGTGKTRMAVELLHHRYKDVGRSIQFHPNTTYENFIGGLAPVQSGTDLGLKFSPTEGFLMEAAREALADPTRDYLLHIDEINRADLSKILGEAVFLLEPATNQGRSIHLPYDFGAPFHRKLALPPNLHILGTMNSADRSIAILDVAIRRRFAFVSLWPRMSVVQEHGCQLMQTEFQNLVSIFIEHASEDAFSLVPGHSYFLEMDEERARESLKVNLAPLLEEYLAQGYVTGFAEHIRSYLQRLRTM